MSVERLSLATATQEQVRVENQLLSRAAAIEVKQGNASGTYFLTTEVSLTTPDVRFHCKIGDQDFGLSVTREWLDDLFPQDMAIVSINDVPAPLDVALSQVLLTPVLASLAELVGDSASVKAVVEHIDQNARVVALAKEVGDEVQVPAQLHLPPPLEELLLGKLNEKPAEPVVPLLPAVPIELFACLASQNLTQEDLYSLSPGAVIVIDGDPEKQEVSLRGGRRLGLLGWGNWDGSALTLNHLGERVMASAEENAEEQVEGPSETPADPDAEPMSTLADAEEVDLEELEVRVDFVLCSTNMTIRELRETGIGSTLVFDTPADGTVSIFAAGQRIGEGEIVSIDGTTGVRLSRVNRRTDV
ncbi:MAG: FliM/FliN family flagellar motor switch protein [Pseudomonadota bacterium]